MPSPTEPPDSKRSRCHECGASVAPDANFCADCGANLDDGSRPQFCGSCGSRFAPNDDFCADCGAVRDGIEHERSESISPEERDSTSPADRDAPASATESAFRRRVRQHLAAGWEVERDDGDTVVLVDRDIGSIPIHVLLLFTTGGLGNLLYGYYHHSTLAETRRLSVDDEHFPMPKRKPDEDTALMTASAYGLSAVVFLVGAFIAVTSADGGSLAIAGVGLLLALAGLSVAPPVEERLGRRHRITAFGRHKTVDHRILEPVDPVEKPCVVCDREFDGGVVRRRRDETLIAGVPIRTHEHERNHYCAVCAREELFGTGPTTPSTDVEESLDEAVGGVLTDRDPVSETATNDE